MPKSISTNTFGVAKWVVSADPTQGTHTTIASALAAASTGDTVFLRDGTFNENLTMVNGIDMMSLSNGTYYPLNTNIRGKLTFSTAGVYEVSGIEVEANGSNCVEVSGSGNTYVTFTNCVFNNTFAGAALNITNSSGLTTITFENCFFYIADSSGYFISKSGNSVVNFYSCEIFNANNSTVASTSSGGSLIFHLSSIQSSFSISGNSGVSFQYCDINNSTADTLSLTSSGTSQYEVLFTEVISNTQPVASVGSGTTLILKESVLASNNTNVVSGSGTVKYGDVTFLLSSQFENTLTLDLFGATPSNAASGYVWKSTGPYTSPTWQPDGSGGGFTSITQQVFTSSGTYTPTAGMAYCIVEVVGGGGGGGGGVNSVGGSGSIGGGGGAGGYSKGVFSSATIGASQSVTIGTGGAGGTSGTPTGTTGGTTSVGSIISATGGSGGVGSGGTGAITTFILGGAGGVGSGGSVNVTGNAGSGGGTINTSGINLAWGGSGGASCLGGAPVQVSTNTDNTHVNGNNASDYGAGGGGGVTLGSSSGNTGGNGSPGIVIITEYIS